MTDFGSRIHHPILEGKHERPIGFGREEEIDKPDIVIVKAIPVSILKDFREVMEEERIKQKGKL